MMKYQIMKDEAVKAFEQFLREEEKSELTISKYCHDVHVFMQFAQKQAVNKELVIRYKQALITTYHYTMVSANSMLAALNSFFRFQKWEDCRVKQYKIQKKVYWDEEMELSKQEYKCLLKAAKDAGDEQMYLILQVLCSTGMRASEIQFLTVEALQKKTITVLCKGKTRDVYIPKKTYDQINDYIEKNHITSNEIFLTKNKQPRSRHSIWRGMKRIGKAAGIPEEKLFPHNLRHLFAREFYAKSNDIAKLADVLGHSSIDTTRIYLISTGKEHAKLIDSMGLTD